MALSMRLCTSRSSRTGSPETGDVERGADLETSFPGHGPELGGRAPGDLGEVDPVMRREVFLAAREGEQAVDEAFVALVDRQQVGAELTQRRAGMRVVEGHFDERSIDGQRGTQFVGG